MEAVEIKTRFHNLIDPIDDLTDSQKIRLNESIQQSKTTDCIPHESVKKEIKEWLIK
jgi:hypothetical protein